MSMGDAMPPRGNATGIVYFAGVMLILAGPVQFINGHPLLAAGLVALGIVLIVQRLLRNRKR